MSDVAPLTLLDKVTLPGKAITDRRGRMLRDLRLSVIDRCNLRCQYCLPAEVFGDDFRFRALDELLSFEQMARLVDAFVALGVEKIRLTGGEPLLRPGMPDFIALLRQAHTAVDLALTTNGLRLAPMAETLKAAGLDRVNISLDAIDPEVAGVMAGRNFAPQSILEAARIAQAAGLGVKLNTVIKRGVNESEILPLAEAARELGVTLRYIEFMDVGNSNGWRREDVVTGAEIREQLSVFGELEPVPASTIGEVARRYRYCDSGLEVGFIESVSAPFCGDCTRARVSATGELFTCLFAHCGIDLKPLLTDEETLPPALARIWASRHDRYSELRAQMPHAGQPGQAPEEMWRLGG